MSIKLYNLSNLPDDLLRSMLVEAKTLAGAKGSVIVRVNRQSWREPSEARRGAWVYEGWLNGKRNWRAKAGRKITTKGGYVIMRPHSYRHPASDHLKIAEDFFETAVHEFAHIVQFQTFKFLSGSYAIFQYHMEWKRRPHELDAINRTDEALSRLAKQTARRQRIDHLIIELALQMESTSK